jgi:hypothetical protein
MSRLIILGIVWVFMVVATVIGLAVYGSLMGTDPLAAFKNAAGGIMISGGIMLGSILMILGGIRQNNQYQKAFTQKPGDIATDQQEYYQQLLKQEDLTEEERKSIENKLMKP